MINNIKKLCLLLVERKHVGTLYHFTSLDNLMKILKSNSLLANRSEKAYTDAESRYSISFTRDKNLHKNYPYGIKIDVTIVLDGDKLSDRYKIQPYEYWYNTTKNTPYYKEAEERIYFKDMRGIQDIKSYIKYIILNTEGKASNIKSLLSKVKEEIENYNISVEIR